MRLDYGQLRQEPAIAGLDWLFTPIRKSVEHLYVEPIQASTKFNPGFTLPTDRSPSFRWCSCDYWHLSYHTPHKLRVYWFPFGCSGKRLSLPHKHTPWHVIHNEQCNSLEPHLTIATRFQGLYTSC